jgi:succinate dehydrogenase / fumarate reductase flavoprotein subunit/fumarate reductase flavoprotein subunit
VTTPLRPEVIAFDVVVLGSGAAGLMAVRHAAQADPALRIALVSKGLVGRSGCSVMAQGINAALGPDDGPDLHVEDILRGGEALSDPSLARALADDAPTVIRELADELGCTFDRDGEGNVRLSPFPGQSRHRKVSHGHLTGLEIVNRLRDDLVRTRPVQFPDHRALDLILDETGVSAVTVLDIRTGSPLVLTARAVVLAAGGSVAASYRVATPAREKSGDGLAMALRAGLPLRDMEMVQFLSVGIVAGASRVTGVLLEEALRFAGAELLNARGERFMERYDPERRERASRDVVAAAAYAEIADGRGTRDGAVLLDCRPIGAEVMAARFADVLRRARSAGVDALAEPVPIAPAAHIGIGGVPIDEHGATTVAGLLVAGEDAGGVHGASWAGGNGIAESTVFGRRAGRRAAEVARQRPARAAHDGVRAPAVDASFGRAYDPFDRPAASTVTAAALTIELRAILWDHVGLRRDGTGLEEASARIGGIRDVASAMAVSGPPAANAAWQELLDLDSRLTVAEATTVAARTRTETRGVHIRRDHPDRDDARWLRTVLVSGRPGALTATTGPVALEGVHAGTAAGSRPA